MAVKTESDVMDIYPQMHTCFISPKTTSLHMVAEIKINMIL